MVLTPPRAGPAALPRGVKPLLFTLALLPALLLAWHAAQDSLGPNPVEALQRQSGSWSFNFLLLTLAMTPLRQLTGQAWPIRLRRMLGLYAFFYATLHLLCFAGFEHGFEATPIAQDILDRRFVLAGFAAWLLMLPLAVTSLPHLQRALGPAHWKALHRSIYVIGVIAALHYLWLVKATALLWPIGYALALAMLLGWRLNLIR